MITFLTELVGEHVVSEAAVFFTEALAKLNARQFAREQGRELPCCARCAGCSLDTSAPLRDALQLLEVQGGHPVSIVAYSVGRELAAGRPCRVVLIDDTRLAYQHEDGTVVDPLLKFSDEKEGGCCGKQDEHDH